MKLKKTFKRIIVALIAVLMICGTVFCAYAVGEEDGEDYQVDTVADVTEAPTYVQETQEPTVATETEAPTYAPETEAPTYVQETEAPQVQAPVTYATYAPTKAAETKLPTVEKQTTPTAIRADEKEIEEKDDLTYGYVSWACVILGILAVVIVLISNKTHYSGGSGKQRYDSGNMMTERGRLLSDDYYKTRKSNSYRSKDIRR
jgi:NADH:ubiquinone oxidoreductase subunit 3 (subunit A)